MDGIAAAGLRLFSCYVQQIYLLRILIILLHLLRLLSNFYFGFIVVDFMLIGNFLGRPSVYRRVLTC